MDVIRAKTAGFCFGVKRAVDTVYEQLEKASESTTIYTYGPIIHNEEVVKDMKQKGVIVLQSEAELDALTEGTVIIRSHGVEKAIYDKLNAKGIKIVDARGADGADRDKGYDRAQNKDDRAGGCVYCISRRHRHTGGDR